MTRFQGRQLEVKVSVQEKINELKKLEELNSKLPSKVDLEIQIRNIKNSINPPIKDSYLRDFIMSFLFAFIFLFWALVVLRDATMEGRDVEWSLIMAYLVAGVLPSIVFFRLSIDFFKSGIERKNFEKEYDYGNDQKLFEEISLINGEITSSNYRNNDKVRIQIREAAKKVDAIKKVYKICPYKTDCTAPIDKIVFESMSKIVVYPVQHDFPKDWSFEDREFLGKYCSVCTDEYVKIQLQKAINREKYGIIVQRTNKFCSSYNCSEVAVKVCRWCRKNRCHFHHRHCCGDGD